MKKLMTVGACAAVAAAVAFGGAAGAAEWPRGFVELEHIQGSGEARFVTDFYPNPQTDKIEAVLSLTDKSLNAAIWCARGATTSTKTFSLFYIANKGFRGDYDGSTAGQITEDLPVDPAKLTVTMNRNVLTSPTGKTYQYTSAAGFTKTDGPMTIFASYYDGTDNNKDNYSNYKLYSFRIWRNGELIHNLVPAKDATGAATLCDVSDTPMTITKEGAFIAGPAASNLKIAAIPEQKWFMRSPVEPHPDVTYVNPETGARTLLTEGTDYELSWSGNTSVGLGMVTVTGKNAYAGEKTATATFDVVNGYGSGKVLLARVNGDADGDCESWESAGTLERAFSLATTAGSVIVLEKGTYVLTQTITTGTQSITLRSETGKADDVIIDGAHSCRLFMQKGNLVFKGVTLSNGMTVNDSTGGNTVNNAAGKDLGFYDCVVEGGITTNNLDAVAGNVWMPNGTLIVSNCVIRNNYVYDTVNGWGAGGFVAMQNGGAVYKFYDTVASNNVFEMNSACQNHRGGNVVFTNCGCEIYDCTFADNLATNRNSSGYARGGVVFARGGTVKAERCAFVCNAAHTSASAIYGSANLTDCAFTNNISRKGVESNNGTVQGTTVTAVGCDFYGNTNNYKGVISASSGATISNCMFSCNKGVRGTAVYCQNNLTLLDSTFFGNEAGNGLLATLSNNKVGAGNTLVDRCTFTGTTATGAVLYFSDGNGAGLTTNVCIRNSVVTGCTGTSLCYAEYCNTIPSEGRTFDNGYGVYFQNLTVTNNTLSGGIFTCGGSMGTNNRDMWFIENCDLKNNGTKKIMVTSDYQDRARHCIVDADATCIRLVAEGDPSYIGNRTDKKFRNKGIVSAWMTQVANPLDYLGNPRIKGPKPDIGAIEWPYLGLMLMVR